MNNCKMKKLVIIIIGCLLYSSGIALFLDPNELAPGGIVGISVILSHTIGIMTGTWYLILNIPIIIIGWWKFGKKFIVSSLFAIALNSFFTNIFQTFHVITEDLFLASVAGSILIGTGIGLILRVGATTGGMDIIIRLIREKYPALKTSTLFIIIDMIIVIISGFVFRDFNIAMFAMITVVLNGKMIDYILYGSDEAKLIYVISDYKDNVIKRILEEMAVGSTILMGKGAYSNERKDIIMCVVKKRYAFLLQDIVKEEDENAFLIVTNANEIYGEGYKSLTKGNL